MSQAPPILAAVAIACAFAGVSKVARHRPVATRAGRSSSRSRALRRRLRFRSTASRSRAAKRYRAAADAEIPQLLDLLAAGSSAGLAAPLALRRAADGLIGPLADEVRATVRAVDLGARWRDELDALTERLDLPDLRRTVSALTRTETLGASLSQATAELAASVRQARRAATMERARTAPVKMLFPLVFLVLPAFLLLTVVPVLLTTVRSIG
ncbi:MAG TPA: type II secretion system F family protein [Actinomycetota bacterium]|nr:type II secretion system F family protein [Actinomycetota bacterium]